MPAKKKQTAKPKPEKAKDQNVEAYRLAVVDYKAARTKLKKLHTEWKNDVKSSRFMSTLSDDDKSILTSAHAAAGRLTAPKSSD